MICKCKYTTSHVPNISQINMNNFSQKLDIITFQADIQYHCEKVEFDQYIVELVYGGSKYTKYFSNNEFLQYFDFLSELRNEKLNILLQ